MQAHALHSSQRQLVVIVILVSPMPLQNQDIRCGVTQGFHVNLFRMISLSLLKQLLGAPKMNKGPIVLGVRHSKLIQRQRLPSQSKEELDLTSTGINGKTHIDFRRH